jgi:hypothetical protein
MGAARPVGLVTDRFGFQLFPVQRRLMLGPAAQEAGRADRGRQGLSRRMLSRRIGVVC